MKTECQAVSALFLSMWMMGPNKVEVNVEAICCIGFASSDDARAWQRPAPARQAGGEGLVSLFDGKTLDGWHAVPKECASDWTVRDGAIIGIGSADRLAYLVWKDEQLTDFELKLRYRLPGKGNTGVEIRSQPDLTGKRPFEGYHADLGHVGIGPQILGAWDFHFAKRKEHPCPRGTRLVIDPRGTPHSIAIRGALTAADVRARQWNDVHIVARSTHFQFFINGKLASEFTDNAQQGRLDQGAIGLQIHDEGMQVEFKDIWLKRLRPASPAEERVPVGSQKQLFVDDYIVAKQTDRRPFRSFSTTPARSGNRGRSGQAEGDLMSRSDGRQFPRLAVFAAAP